MSNWRSLLITSPLEFFSAGHVLVILEHVDRSDGAIYGVVSVEHLVDFFYVVFRNVGVCAAVFLDVQVLVNLRRKDFRDTLSDFRFPFQSEYY